MLCPRGLALERELTSGFDAQGFRVVDAGAPADAQVKARLRAFKFFVEYGFFLGAENTDVVVGIEAASGGDEIEHIYRASDEVPAMFVPGGEGIDQKLNAALAYVLSQIMKDKELMTFLARRPAAGV